MKALAAGLLFAALAVAPAGAADREAMRQTGSFTDCDEVKTVDFVAAADAVDPKLELSARVRRGQVVFKIVRPDGSVEADLGTDDEVTVSLDPDTFARHPGTWHVEITMKNATGRYEVRYTTARSRAAGERVGPIRGLGRILEEGSR